MSESPYQIRGGSVPQMLGRELLFEKLCGHLTKSTPDHVCVVGPPGFGKSVILNHLARHFQERADNFAATMYWDLRHGTPKTDDEFRRRFAERIKLALQLVDFELAGYLELEDEGLPDLLHLVFEEMESNGIRFLAVLDGFDHVLAGSGITRNLWDELRTLCQMSSLRVVTGSRSRLRALCKTEDSRTSNFWEIFNPEPLKIGCFENSDWRGILNPFDACSVKFEDSASKEIGNWTGGVPVLAVALAGRLLANAPQGALLSKQHVDNVAKTLVEDRRELLAALWDDCPIELQSVLAALANDNLSISEVPDHDIRDLELRGFARSSGNNLRSSCRLMAQYAREQAGEVNNLRRLFGDAERFEGNIRSLLELRLAQIAEVDPGLLGDVKNVVRDLHPQPTQSTTWARSIADRALDLIWKAELPSGGSIPEAWKFVGVRFYQLPRRRGQQCNILRQITGTEDHAPVAKYVTKPTYLLVDHLQSVGDFGQHKQGTTVSVSIAASFCLSAIALCESLAKDLEKASASGNGEEG